MIYDHQLGPTIAADARTGDTVKGPDGKMWRIAEVRGAGRIGRAATFFEARWNALEAAGPFAVAALLCGYAWMTIVDLDLRGGEGWIGDIAYFASAAGYWIALYGAARHSTLFGALVLALGMLLHRNPAFADFAGVDTRLLVLSGAVALAIRPIEAVLFPGDLRAGKKPARYFPVGEARARPRFRVEQVPAGGKVMRLPTGSSSGTNR